MNSANPSTPSLQSLYWNDVIFKRMVNTCGFAVIVAAGITWASQPMPNAPPPESISFDPAALDIVPPIALGVAAVALMIAVWRYLQVQKFFTQGKVVRGTVEELKTETWRTTANVDQSHGIKYKTMHSHYITLRYTMHGKERSVRQKLPNSGFTFGLQQGGEVDLMVLDSMPDKPLIRAVYLGRR